MWIFGESTQKARIEHFCDRCCEWIQPGETYERKVWTPDRVKFFVMKEHRNPRCPEFELDEEREVEAEQTVSFRLALVLEAVVMQLIGGGTETKIVPRMKLVGETGPDDGDWPESPGIGDDDMPF